MSFDLYEVISSGASCRVTWKGIPGHGSGEKELFADEGPAELQGILDWSRVGGEVLFFYPDSEDPNTIHEKSLLPLL